jgi:hypothetical protein
MNDAKQSAACVGPYVVAHVSYGAHHYKGVSLQLVSPSHLGEQGAYSPAESVQIYGLDAVKDLHTFCTAIIAECEERKKKENPL